MIGKLRDKTASTGYVSVCENYLGRYLSCLDRRLGWRMVDDAASLNESSRKKQTILVGRYLMYVRYTPELELVGRLVLLVKA